MLVGVAVAKTEGEGAKLCDLGTLALLGLQLLLTPTFAHILKTSNTDRTVNFRVSHPYPFLAASLIVSAFVDFT